MEFMESNPPDSKAIRYTLERESPRGLLLAPVLFLMYLAWYDYSVKDSHWI